MARTLSLLLVCLALAVPSMADRDLLEENRFHGRCIRAIHAADHGHYVSTGHASGIDMAATICRGDVDCQHIAPCESGDCMQLHRCESNTNAVCALYVPVHCTEDVVSAPQSAVQSSSVLSLANKAGSSVALGDRFFFVGAPKADSAYDKTGLVYAAHISSNEAILQELVGDQPGKKDNFGAAVATFGTTLMVGAPGADTSIKKGGKVEVFTMVRNAWERTQVLAPAGLAQNDDFGASVALGNGVAIVGAPRDSSIKVKAGAAYVYAADREGQWYLIDKLQVSRPKEKGRCGMSVAISGLTAVVGCSGKKERAFVFALRDGTFTELTQIKQGANNFGQAVAIASNELAYGPLRTAVLIGAPDQKDGRAFMYELQSDGQAERTEKFKPKSDANPNRFGASVALSPGGRYSVIGAPGESGTSDIGRVFAYERQREWELVLEAVAPDVSAEGDQLGTAVDIRATSSGFLIMASAPKALNDGAVTFISS
ncbi:uncharacterized protein MONBRDRAFT_25795 [Monosiga brevicollis MX1]|uniref:Uncharacterized protein n=1 Tax=Monosiga brevicollis TaxID=81824 RepID=A9V0G4_MONBE|nr:uncharacterized protein MONBRDRAFT_25795 [Monosiga brevicollis MX1]EDQ89008.1 predicted protein [Monosiga brevicollis MX1]|eukprot:XP_001746113.1 hypothetical protein [Monosiga brevicollis MX1]